MDFAGLCRNNIGAIILSGLLSSASWCLCYPSAWAVDGEIGETSSGSSKISITIPPRVETSVSGSERGVLGPLGLCLKSNFTDAKFDVLTLAPSSQISLDSRQNSKPVRVSAISLNAACKGAFNAMFKHLGSDQKSVLVLVAPSV